MPDEPAAVGVSAELLRDWGARQRVELKTVCLDPTPVQVNNMGKEEHIHTLLQEFHDDMCVHLRYT